MNDKVTILDVPFSTYSLEQTVEVLVQSVQIDRSKPFHLITGNPEIILKNQAPRQTEKKSNFRCRWKLGYYGWDS